MPWLARNSRNQDSKADLRAFVALPAALAVDWLVPESLTRPKADLLRGTIMVLAEAAVLGPRRRAWTPTCRPAARVGYGDSPDVPPGFRFLGVTESSGTDPVPLYGPPGYVPGGMHVKPLGFAASATGGARDITDGQLNFTLAGDVIGTQIAVIDSIAVNEWGYYTLTGSGTLSTTVIVDPAVHLTVTQIDGVDVSPILLSTSVPFQFYLTLQPGLMVSWGLSTNISIGSELAGLGIPFVGGATRIDVVIDNALIAMGEPGSVVFMAKKDFQANLKSSFAPIVPDPATIGLFALGSLLFARRRRV